MIKPNTSIVIPVYNEAENLRPLFVELVQACDTLEGRFGPFEIIFVNDGSTDDSMQVLKSLREADSRLFLIEFRANFGKTAALTAGFQAASGKYVVTMDADLQDNPADLSKLLEQLNRFDLVAAWRKNRRQNDPPSKTLISSVYNAIVRMFTGIDLHDFNCGYKSYRKVALDELRLYGRGLHRYTPVLAHWRGFRVTEVEVNHRPRYAGKSKFGYSRLLAGLLDFIVVLFLTRYLHQPLRMFGLLGLFSVGAGMMINLYLAALWFLRLFADTSIAPIGTRPLLAVGVLAILFGCQLISLGLLAEMIRYYMSRETPDYSVRSYHASKFPNQEP